MNNVVAMDLDILHQTQAIRNELMDVLTDEDLAYHLPGNMTLGELCVGIGEVERSYIDSFKTFHQDWSSKNTDPELSGSVARLKTWYQVLDSELDTVLGNFTEADMNRVIDRGFPLPARVQLHVYREALLIFYGRATLYLRALQKPIPQQMQLWIG